MGQEEHRKDNLEWEGNVLQVGFKEWDLLEW